MRVFLGCFLTPDSAQALAARVPAVPGMRPVPTSNLHVTLHFLGSVATDLADAVRALSDSLPPASHSVRVCSFTGLPKPGRARVLAAEIEDPQALLSRWHEHLAGQWPTGETRRYFPHVTLARSGKAVRLPEMLVPQHLVLELQPPAAYVSETRPEGARYRRLD